MSTAKKSAPRATKPADAADFGGFAAAETFSNATRERFDAVLTAFNEQAETARGQAEEMMETARTNFETARTRLEKANASLVDAARKEMAEAVDFANELARAKTLSDALEIQRDYWTNLFETRVERARDFNNVAVETARESFEPFSKTLNSAFGSAKSFEKFFPFAAK